MPNNVFSLVLALLAALPVFGHSVWIEPSKDGQLIIRFAEPDGKFEKSPGHLDELTVSTAWTRSAQGLTALVVEKKSDHFSIVNSHASAATQIETRFEVMAALGRPGRLPCFYARWSPDLAEASPALTLDLVPTGKVGEVRAFFRGKPLPAVKATLRTPDEKEQSLTADDEGIFHFESKQPGQHLLNVAHHRESLPGFASGRAYEQTSHNAALSWVQK